MDEFVRALEEEKKKRKRSWNSMVAHAAIFVHRTELGLYLLSTISLERNVNGGRKKSTDGANCGR